MKNSSIAIGHLKHVRVKPHANSFGFKHAMLLVDLDDFPNHSTPWLIKYNRRGLLSINDTHYIDKSSLGLKQKLLRFLDQMEATIDTSDRFLLLTTPALAGYSFNPVVFFFILTADKSIKAIAVEVHNTFGESHIYYLDKDSWDEAAGIYISNKRFHVSPFLARNGYYEFRFLLTASEVNVHINLYQDEQMILGTTFTGRLIPITSKSLFRFSINLATTVLLTELRILQNAYKLFFRLRLPFFQKPERLEGTSDSPSKALISNMKLPFSKRKVRS